MGTYREEHQPHRHDHRAFVHGEQQSELTAAEITKAAEELSKLRRQVSLRDAEAVEAVVQEIDNACFQILSRTDDGTLPPVVIQLKAELADAKDEFLR